jgi:hypothetical protein
MIEVSQLTDSIQRIDVRDDVKKNLKCFLEVSKTNIRFASCGRHIMADIKDFRELCLAFLEFEKQQ